MSIKQRDYMIRIVIQNMCITSVLNELLFKLIKTWTSTSFNLKNDSMKFVDSLEI